MTIPRLKIDVAAPALGGHQNRGSMAYREHIAILTGRKDFPTKAKAVWGGRSGSDVRISEQNHGRLNEDDRLELARLLLKAGYTVRIGREKPPGKKTNAYFVEYEEAE